MPDEVEDEKPGLIFREARHKRVRALMRFLLIALVMTVAAALLDGVKAALTHHEPAVTAAHEPQSSVAVRAQAFAPPYIAALYLAAMPPLTNDTAIGMPSPLPTLATSTPERTPRPSGTPLDYAHLLAHHAGTGDPLAVGEGMRAIASMPTTQSQIAAAAPTLQPVAGAVSLHHWAGSTFSWFSPLLALADVVVSLLSSGTLSAKFFALSELLLGTIVTFWVVACVRALVTAVTRNPDAASWPNDSAGQFFFVVLIWPVGTVLFASVMVVIAQTAGGFAASLFGVAHSAIADAFADVSIYTFGCAFAASALELRIHALAEAAVNAL